MDWPFPTCPQPITAGELSGTEVPLPGFLDTFQSKCQWILYEPCFSHGDLLSWLENNKAPAVSRCLGRRRNSRFSYLAPCHLFTPGVWWSPSPCFFSSSADLNRRCQQLEVPLPSLLLRQCWSLVAALSAGRGALGSLADSDCSLGQFFDRRASFLPLL